MIIRKGIALKLIEPKDLPWLAALIGNPKIHSTLAPEMAEVTEANVAQHIASTDAGTGVKAFIIMESGAYIGFIVLNAINGVNRTCCVSMLALLPEKQGRMRAKNAILAVVEYAFYTLNLRKGPYIDSMKTQSANHPATRMHLNPNLGCL